MVDSVPCVHKLDRCLSWTLTEWFGETNRNVSISQMTSRDIENEQLSVKDEQLSVKDEQLSVKKEQLSVKDR